jgi:hypothetical protein
MMGREGQPLSRPILEVRGRSRLDPVHAKSPGVLVEFMLVLGFLTADAQRCRGLGFQAFVGNFSAAVGALLVGARRQPLEGEVDFFEEVLIVVGDPVFDQIIGDADGLFFGIMVFHRIRWHAVCIYLGGYEFALFQQPSTKLIGQFRFHHLS